MESALNNATAWKETNVCCCCLKGGCFKDISSEYYFSGQKEVYGNMLKDTFDIPISPEDTIITIAHICECCITKLRDATTFKLMVVENAKRYTHFVDSLNYEKGSSPLDTEVKLEVIKSESPAMDIHFNESSYEDNEIAKKIGREYRVMPLFEKGLYENTYTKYYSLKTNDFLKCRWIEYNRHYEDRVFAPFKFVDIRDYHFYKCRNRLIPSENFHTRAEYRKKLKPGPGVDFQGQMPIPQEALMKRSQGPRTMPKRYSKPEETEVKEQHGK